MTIQGFKTITTILMTGAITAMMAGGAAYADNAGKPYDPSLAKQRIEKRVDRALTGTDATADQKKQIADILAASLRDMRPLHDQRTEDRKAMQAALQAPTLDATKIEAIRADEMKVADESSKRLTKALTDAGNVLSVEQRQAFFKSWNGASREHRHVKRG
jgi:Spy/CpxP family protein refolding chaperone